MDQDKENQILAMYVRGCTFKQIAGAVGVGEATVGRVAERNGKPKRGRGGKRNIVLNEHAFDRPLSDEASYWLGMLITDGSIGEGYRVMLGLKADDRAHVERFREFIGTGAPVKSFTVKVNGKEFPQCRVDVYSKQLVSTLSEYGIVRRKTLTATASPDLCSNRHFWRGVVDGDGSFTILEKGQRKYLYLRLCGSENLLVQFSDFIQSISGTGGSVHIRPHGRVYLLTVGCSTALAVASLLYKETDLFLPRKIQRIQEVQGFREAFKARET